MRILDLVAFMEIAVPDLCEVEEEGWGWAGFRCGLEWEWVGRDLEVRLEVGLRAILVVVREDGGAWFFVLWILVKVIVPFV